jgi:CubicO group peptidase (beta-lactamase class C family)
VFNRASQGTVMVRIIIGLAVIIGVAIASAAGWYYRPWSPYSPAGIAHATLPENLTHTFRTMGEVFPYRTISANPEGVDLPRSTENAEVFFDWNESEKSVADWMAESETTGLMILRNGEVVHEEYGLGATSETRHTSWSVGKSFVATLVAMAVREGRINNLDQSVELLAPQFAGTDYGDTTLRHLLMMSAGVDFEEDYSDPESDIRRLFLGAAIHGKNLDDLVGEVVRDRSAGEDLHYVSANTHVLSAVVRAVYRAPLASIMEEKIWNPLGMTGDATWNQYVQGDNGIAIGYCCLNARLEDYARFGQFYLQDGVWDGNRLLPEGWVTQATRPNADFQEAGPDAVYPNRGYGLHFWVPENHDGEYFMAGVFGQYIWVDERRNIVIARTAADQEWGPRTVESFAALRALAEHYGDEVETPLPMASPDTNSSTDADDE